MKPKEALELKRKLALTGNFQLRELIATEREEGRAFGPVAEAARLELERRGHRV
jgi:hypothetical protein